MTTLDAQVEQQQQRMALGVATIRTTVEALSDDYVFRMIFIFSDLLSANELQNLLGTTIPNSQKIICLLQYVLNHKKASPSLFLKIWGELLFLTKLYKYLKAHDVCKHNMKSWTLSGATFFSSELQRVLLSICDDLTDDDVHYIWTKSLNGALPIPQQPEMLLFRMQKKGNMTDTQLLNELSLHFNVLGRSELVQQIEQYLAKIVASINREEYDLSPPGPGRPCGVALIFNNKTFKKAPHPSTDKIPLDKLGDRNGTDVDAEELEKLWTSFGISTTVFLDFTSVQFLQCLTNHLNNRELEFVKIFIVCILTHGEEGIVYMSDRVDVETTLIESHLGKSVLLAGKPKLLLIQACQGHAVQAKGTNPVLARSVELDNPQVQTQYINPVPQYSDMLIGLATVPRFMSIRNVVKGTHFIQTVVAVLKASGTKQDISSLIPEINYKVSEMWAQLEHKKKKLVLVQMPTFHNQLRKALRFKRITFQG